MSLIFCVLKQIVDSFLIKNTDTGARSLVSNPDFKFSSSVKKKEKIIVSFSYDHCGD